MSQYDEWTDEQYEDDEDFENLIDYGIWARVSGGITGTREAWLKDDGIIFTTHDRQEAEERAADLNQKMNHAHSTASFRYIVEIR